MKLLAVLLVALAGVTSASDRGDLEFSLGAGAWMPSLFDSDAQLSPGPAFTASLQIPPSLGDVFIIRLGYLNAGSDRNAFDGLSAVPLTVGYRLYPMYRRFAGPRGIEPLIGIFGGGMILWDSPDGGSDGASTGAGVVGAEIGARVRISQGASLDLVIKPEWVRAGSGLAGEGKDLSGLELTASISF